ncbi:hypothetical protein [Ferruginivarius sediminum]|uniref:Uncharacterized protein n=1 Tax=Ferruginivarius sediminum TaxID=2661937 RepID=A0A369T596_9PROT|nr:hypothetical protein [Ferruginivarius sediminum]RDD60500.1 hypothetical protein DRB17_17520 [Ferruginivarius sediminum]
MTMPAMTLFDPLLGETVVRTALLGTNVRDGFFRGEESRSSLLAQHADLLENLARKKQAG